MKSGALIFSLVVGFGLVSPAARAGDAKWERKHIPADKEFCMHLVQPDLAQWHGPVPANKCGSRMEATAHVLPAPDRATKPTLIESPLTPAG